MDIPKQTYPGAFRKSEKLQIEPIPSPDFVRNLSACRKEESREDAKDCRSREKSHSTLACKASHLQ